jgi:hypothetical protein
MPKDIIKNFGDHLKYTDNELRDCRKSRFDAPDSLTIFAVF